MEENDESMLEEIMQEVSTEETVDKTETKTEEKTESKLEENTKDEDTTKIDLSSFKASNEPEVFKIDLNKPLNQEENETKEDNADDSGVVAESEDTESTQEQKEVQPETETQETPILEEKPKVEDVAVEEKQQTVTEQPVQQDEPIGDLDKLKAFMKETGGSVEDYVNLNRDYSKLDDVTVLREYYKGTKSHLSAEEIDFMMEDQFAYDEEYEDAKDVKRKKLALKEQVANARAQLEGLKSRYYEEIKAGSKLTGEQQKAIDFFNNYNENSKVQAEQSAKQQAVFQEETNKVFHQKFEGFEYNVGDKIYRYKVKDANAVRESQLNIGNFIEKFLDKSGNMSKTADYHKSIFTASNPDVIAKHFYEQGKADALKQSIAESKNVSMKPRQEHGEVKVQGVQFKPLSGNTTSDFKVKIRK